MRCNGPAAEAVARPVEAPPSGSVAPTYTAGRSNSVDILEVLWLSLVLTVVGLEQLRKSQRWAAKVLWSVVLLAGVSVVAVPILAAVCGDGFPGVLWVVSGVLGLFGVGVVVWQAGHEQAASGEQLRMSVSVCQRHRQHWQVYRRVVVAFTLGGVLYVVALVAAVVIFVGNPFQIGNQAVNWLGGGLLGLMVLIAAAALVFRAPIKVVREQDGAVVISGVSDEYARALADPKTGQEPSR
jgi:hypothetical protein